MQIKTIALYGKNRDRRDVEFGLATVNVITGASKKGKSSLIDIVEYCLGASECNVAKGRITETVAWYAVLLQFEDSQVFIARSAPLDGQKTSSAAHMLIGPEIELPDFSELQSSTNIDAVVKFLTGKVGIHENVTEVPRDQTRGTITLGFKHSRFYLFQGQDEIANKRTLFHRQAEPHIPQAIKDTIPYFMGAAEDDRLAEIERLRGLKRRQKKVIKRIAESELLEGDGLQRGYQLLAEAADVGLVDIGVPTSEEALIEELQQVANWRPSSDLGKDDSGDAYFELETRYQRARAEKNSVRARLKAAEAYADTMTGFENQLNEQGLRLHSIGLYENLQAINGCPICESEHQDRTSAEEVIYRAIRNLDEKLEGVNRNKPRIVSYIHTLREKDESLAQEVKRLRGAVKSVQAQQPELHSRADLDDKRARIAGRVSLYIESVDFGEDDLPELKAERELLAEQIYALEEKLDPAALRERLEAQLSCVSEDMTRWARELGLEHSEHPIRLDVSNLTVVAETRMGRTPLYMMGSGENWVGYHLVTYLALAKWFIEQSRPVGRFIFFDQPSQVYFPSDLSSTGSLDEIQKDEDREAVKALFKWIVRVVEQLSPSLQVIITDHADIDEEWFQSLIVDQKWRGESALIPNHWYQ